MHSRDSGNEFHSPHHSHPSHPQPLAAQSSIFTPLTLPADRALALDELSRTALEHLAEPDLMRHLLGRLREIMGADNAAILLAPDHLPYLTIYTVEGPEEAVSEQVRVPIGEGVAGTIFATQAPLLVDDLTAVPVSNPFLREHLRSLIGVPIMLHGHAIGALHVDSVRPNHFNEADVPFVQAIADRLALAVDHARLFRIAQNARHEAEARSRQLDAIFAAMTDAVFVMDREGRVVQMNAAAHDLLGLAESDDFYARPLEERPLATATLDATGRPLPVDLWPTQRILRGQVLTGRDAVDVTVRRADGRLVELSITGAPIRDENGAVVASVSICRDVTERRQLERRTRESLDALLQMAQTLVTLPAGLPAAGESPQTLGAEDAEQPAGVEHRIAHQLAVLTSDVVGCTRVGIVSVEPESERIHAIAVVGLSPEQERQWWSEQRQREAQGARLSDSTDADVLARIRAGEAFVLDMTKPPYNERPNPYGITAVLVAPMQAGGTLVGILTLDFGGPRHILTADEIALAGAVAQLAAVVLERDRLLRERARSEAHVLALHEAQATMDSFIGVAGHELKTPLTTAVASSQLAARRLQSLAAAIRALDAPGAESLEPLIAPLEKLIDRISAAAHRQGRLVDDLLDVSRIQSGRLELERQPLDLRQLVAEVVEEQRLHHPGRTVLLRLPGAEVRVLADPDRIGQAVTNLLTNALKYSPSNASVTVQVRVQGNMAQVRVRDRGPGIPPDEQAYVWNRFHRVPGVEVQSGSGVGLGLGLYITHEIVERHEGETGVVSAPSRGSTFWFALPLADPGAQD
ncbi:MAG TPA: GAF domain-containing protein [Ktedonobacterales bacterium]|nr:GAF domain-containing protein [Ktedonobacterales bacterium]